MTKIFVYSVVFRDSDNNLKHLLSQCVATSPQEARGWAHEQFDKEYPRCKISSLLIQEIVANTEIKSHEYSTPRATPEFTLKPNF